tara:strand:- start:184 stop:606 length:423 start_codon:yes stop_codon:yes gene_type:complete
MEKPVKDAVAYVIYNNDRSKFLVVQRPSDDEDLPDAWGLPAGSLKEGESFEDAVLRSGRQKLGIELKVLSEIGEGEIEREQIVLRMKEYEVEVVNGYPNVHQRIKGVTIYQDQKWGTSDDLRDAASKGSLCCKLYLENVA